VHVARRPLAGELARLAGEARVVGGDVLVGQRPRREAVEEVLLLALAARAADLRVPQQRLEPPGGARALGADADEVRRSDAGAV
jgi:hypothetical protein